MHEFVRVIRLTACVLSLSLLAALGLAGCGGDEGERLPDTQLRIATGLDGGVYRIYGRAIAKAVNRHLAPLGARALTTDGSIENLERLEDRTADIAFTLADTAAAAVDGTTPFKRPIKMAALAHLYDDYVQIIARRTSPLRDVRDLVRATVSLGAPRSGTSLIAKRILALPRLRLTGSRAPSVKLLPLAASAAALADGRIDAFFWSGGLPTDAIVALSKQEPIRLLGLPAGVAAALDPDLYTETHTPAYAYGPAGVVRTITASNLLVVRQDMPAAVAFALTGMLFEHKDDLVTAHPEVRRLSPRSAIATTYPLELHPGAARWYRQQRP